MNKVKRVWLFVLLCCMTAFNTNAAQYAFQIKFTDKAGTAGNLGSPLSFLSQRSLDRRAQQGIALDSTDLPVSAAYIDSVLMLTSGKMHGTSRWLNMCVVLLYDSSQILQLQNKPFISNIKLVGTYSTFLHNKTHHPAETIDYTINTRHSPLLKATDDAAYYGNTYAQTYQVNGNYLHDLGYRGQGKLIAVLDEGFDGVNNLSGFDSLFQSGRLLDTYNFKLDTGYVYAYADHGTDVLSTMAGYVPGTFVGSAPLAQYALYITEDAQSEQPIELFNLVEGAERADSLGADIITESLGYNYFDNPADDLNFSTDLDGKTTVAAQGANMAVKKGMLFLASAGNEGGDSWNRILTPGDADSALTVGAVSTNGLPASFSGYGPNAAGQIKPDVCALGNPAAIFNNNGYESADGTSFSTPEIAGWAACLMCATGNTRPYQLRNAINESANYYNNPGQQIGYGIPNFQVAMQTLKVEDTPNPAGLKEWLIITPNPFQDRIILSARPAITTTASFYITDITGKTVMRFEQHFTKGYNTPVFIEMPANLPAGIYILKAKAANQQQVIKLEKS